MAKIVFWSPEQGRGNTSNAVAIGTMIGQDYDIRTLITQTHFRRSNLESAFMKAKELQFRNLVNTTTSGMDNLERLFKSKRLSVDSICDHTISLETGRLDLLMGTKKAEAHESYPSIAGAIFDEADRYYQAVILDIHSGGKDIVSHQLIKDADIVVVTLSQDTSVIENYVEQKEWPDELQNKTKIILLGQYDKYSKYNVANIKRNYKINDPIYGLPYSSEFRDAFNDKDVLNWFRRARNAGKRHPSYNFFQEVRKISKELLIQIGVNTEIKRIERGVS
ncbi:hypothetical protein IAQ67_14940 [Paenibacillus peoriae]|uniref:Uncharacterized protein n=1 Tax=Paenibacillus peoriae TaxID=59893 RepID=A0A7H0Y2A2_9BACL|nr:hypothetical protein [Paenibacillus peoriae]QNR65210.1 hypothetical protein IAQ67_14940 [Paenibacillus peoriae]